MQLRVCTVQLRGQQQTQRDRQGEDLLPYRGVAGDLLHHTVSKIPRAPHEG